MVQSCESDSANMCPWSSEGGECQPLSLRSSRANVLDYLRGGKRWAGSGEGESRLNFSTKQLGGRVLARRAINSTTATELLEMRIITCLTLALLSTTSVPALADQFEWGPLT